MLKKIGVLNTWIGSQNIGDQIIMDGCKKFINENFSKDFHLEFPTHEKIGMYSYKILNTMDLKLVCGTNLLKSDQTKNRVWNIGLRDSLFLKDVVLLGVGANSYYKKIDPITRLIWKRVLSKNKIHSVRDDYTKELLNKLGFENVITTSCATMWGLTEEHCKKIPTKKAENVVFTLTDYDKNLESDRQLVEILLKNYKKVYFWPQGSKDLEYLNEIGCMDKVEIIGMNLLAYDILLKSKEDLDFIGTRLHGGIRALQNFRRTIIISIDNRAEEKRKYGLCILKRENILDLEELLHSEVSNKIKLPLKEIEEWKKSLKKINKVQNNKNIELYEKSIKIITAPYRIIYRIFIRKILGV